MQDRKEVERSPAERSLWISPSFRSAVESTQEEKVGSSGWKVIEVSNISLGASDLLATGIERWIRQIRI